MSNPATPSPDFAVVGGGIIGLACAWRLAQAGARVTVLEKHGAGRESSHAAGGMVAPDCEEAAHPWHGDEDARDAMRAFCRASRDLYPRFAYELLETSGIDVELSLQGASQSDWREPGILFVGPTDTGLNDADSAANAKREWRGRDARWFACDGQVDNRKLVEALREACIRAGVQLCEKAPVERIELEAQRVTALHTPAGVWHPDKVLLCAGAWSGKIAGLPREAVPPVRPLAGQILQLRGEKRLPHVVYTPDCYLVPRRDGRLLVGATVEETGFSKRVTVSGVWSLLSSAIELCPDLGGAPFESSWAGLRPASPDGLPFLGPGPLENLFYATGHGRNGVLGAPQTAQIIANALVGGHEWPDFARLDRFSRV